ncbi:lysozyme [Bartonella henselae]|uniref:lysozyme n=1 Tax=Bartonella henselae TaxID=38323 RepID=UPI003CC95EAC
MEKQMRKVSQEGLALIKQWEGLRLEACKDTVCVWSIGYGHPVKRVLRLSKKECVLRKNKWKQSFVKT